jgi:hypothetical protein
VKVTTADSEGTGTSPIGELLKSLVLWKGDEKSKNNDKKRRIKADLATLIHLHTVGAAVSVFPTPVSATVTSFANPAAAADATYVFRMEIAINLGPGQYYAELSTFKPDVLEGYTTAPSVNVVASLEFVDCGLPFAHEDSLTITEETNNAFFIPAADRIFYLCSTELSSILSSLSYDTAYDEQQVQQAEANASRLIARSMAMVSGQTSLPWPYAPANPAVIAGTVYYAFIRSSETPRPSSLKLTASTKVIYGWYAPVTA